jgi:membrane protein YqaA with SNARE-associated domain
MTDLEAAAGGQRYKRGVFARLYEWMLQAAAHRHATFWLGAVSFSESSFFPIPPDIMLAPMTLRRPERWAWLALFTTLSSVLGGVLGYYLGHWFIDALLPWIDRLGYHPAYTATVGFFAAYGFWAIIVKGLTPVPYKIFTIAAGAAAMPLLPFIAASFIGRGIRFFAVAGLVRYFGPAIEPRIRRYIDTVGWIIAGLVAVAAVYLMLH